MPEETPGPLVTPEPPLEPGPTAEPTPIPTKRRVDPAPKAEAEPKRQPRVEVPPAPGPTPVPEPTARLHLYPTLVKADVDERTKVTAWVCPRAAEAAFGEDGEPRTADDDCRPVKVTWEHKYEGRATLSKDEGYGTAITLTAPLDNRIYARLGGLTASAKVRWRPAPPVPTPDPPPASPPESSDHEKQAATQPRELATPVPSPGPAGDPGVPDDERHIEGGST
jgi:hypothetical protein